MPKLSPSLVYSPQYNIKFFGIEKLHPFDSCKFQRAWDILSSDKRLNIEKHFLRTDRPASRQELLSVHSDDYLELLKSPSFVAQALEVPLAGFLPTSLIDSHVLEPMRFATRGTILATQEALRNGAAINLGGGYHHASRERGEGFCIYADISIAIQCLRQQGLLSPNDKVAIIDLDAHQGNGVERNSLKDDSIYILDMYNSDIYPNDTWIKKRINMDIPVHSGIDDVEYLSILKNHLPDFLSNGSPFSLAIYNAGTDIYKEDSLGKLSVSAEGILERDQFVLTQLESHHIPWVMLPSGGYTKDSAELVARSISFALSDLR